MWRSHPIEVLRTADDEGEIRRGDRYFVTAGDTRARDFVMPISQLDLLDYLDDHRYVGTSRTEADREATREQMQAAVSKLIAVTAPTGRLQVDLVINAREVAALPFEIACSYDDGAPLFVGRPQPVILTRRIRGEFRERATPWPAKPNVLFIAAQPREPVPLDEHLAALRAALGPWVEPLAATPEAMPDEGKVFTRCAPTLEGIATACADAKRPFTHVHVLAHGESVAEGRREKFGLLLASSADPVTAEQFVEALGAGGTLPTVATLAVCDSANAGATSVSGASLAHALHAAGVPVVLASQFPLTWEGSSIAVETLYRALLAGTDVRDAIHKTRDALYRAADVTQHDWKSLVAYVRLPEGYADQLLDVALAADLAALETADRWGKHLVEHVIAAAGQYDGVIARLEERIQALTQRVVQCQAAGRRTLLTESRGLLGSAYKRLAELLFRCTGPSNHERSWSERSRDALDEAARCYVAAYDDDPSDHWVGVQALSLEVVAHGRVREPWRWHAAMHAARPPEDPGQRVWSCGSRAELALLAPYAGEPAQPEVAANALIELVAMCADDAACDDEPAFPATSTRRQLVRYTSWWTRDNGFFDGQDDLAEQVRKVLATAGL